MDAVLLEILECFCYGLATRDADGVMQRFAPDADVVTVTSQESLLRGPDAVRAFSTTPRQRTARRPYSCRRLRGAVSLGPAVMAFEGLVAGFEQDEADLRRGTLSELGAGTADKAWIWSVPASIGGVLIFLGAVSTLLRLGRGVRPLVECQNPAMRDMQAAAPARPWACHRAAGIVAARTLSGVPSPVWPG